MKFSWRYELPQWILIAGMFAYAAVSWSDTPERLPVHWNFEGEVDRYGGRFAGLLFVPLMALGLYLLLLFLPRIDPGQANYPRFATVYALIRLMATATFAVIYAAMVLAFHGTDLPVQGWMPLLIGFPFLFLGAVMGKIRPNWFVGIRTPWTLSSKTSWIKTHRIGGWLFLLIGASFVTAAFVRGAVLTPLLFFVVPGVSLAWLVVYSYLVWRTDVNRISPGGTVPDEERSDG